MKGNDNIRDCLVGLLIVVVCFILPICIHIYQNVVYHIDSLNEEIVHVNNLVVQEFDKKVKLQEQLRYQQKQIKKLNPEINWLARALISETDDSLEMVHVGWVIRNRVEHQWNNKNNYRQVILDRNQFSGFNRNYRFRYTYLTKSCYDTTQDIFIIACQIAEHIIYADSNSNPIPNALYFYSPISMVPKYKKPGWVYNKQEIHVDLNRDRFRFYGK